MIYDVYIIRVLDISSLMMTFTSEESTTFYYVSSLMTRPSGSWMIFIAMLAVAISMECLPLRNSFMPIIFFLHFFFPFGYIKIDNKYISHQFYAPKERPPLTPLHLVITTNAFYKQGIEFMEIVLHLLMATSTSLWIPMVKSLPNFNPASFLIMLWLILVSWNNCSVTIENIFYMKYFKSYLPISLFYMSSWLCIQSSGQFKVVNKVLKIVL